MKKSFLLSFFILPSMLFSVRVYGDSGVNSIPAIPLIPAAPIEKTETAENGEVKIRKLIRTGSALAKVKAKVVVPLEIISDVDIKALVVDDENLEIPFELELSRKPEAKNMYKLNFSSTKIDIDKDGKIDTEIFANKDISKRIIRDNYVKITGKNISREGTHKKKVYITVEVKD